ncbi:putative heparinase superfamily protein [Maritalea mobilis]|uniref:Putative heparinase superfamily protein n=1 Tax=Maritalea mobilis TaxID=483324 RepID=A0A4R6VM85_9HYPH|nr:heparinase II/III family protein [Maritalea mobilis]TDQ60445.1 putative heparinase superfamily protein [Maritalea mobilis]
MVRKKIEKLGLYFHTLKYLRPVQLYNRVYRRFFKPKIVEIPAEEMPCSDVKGSISSFIPRRQEWFEDGTVQFLNIQDDFLAHRWGSYPQSLLWHYSLHYFAELRRTTDIEIQNRMIASWVQDKAPGSKIAWDPYPISLRAVNWIYAHLKRLTSSQAGLEPAALSSLRKQLCFLSQTVEWHLLGNHLFENGKSLLIGGLFFDGKRADELRDQGARILLKQIDEQILQDGAHFELSPMYHALILEGVLEIVAIARLFPQRRNQLVGDLVEKIASILPKMFDWLAHMVHPDGDYAFFNDAGLGIAPTYQELADFAQRLGFNIEIDLQASGRLLESGYCRMKKGDAVVIADFAEVGPSYIPGHAHADTLCFEFSIGPNRVFVNSGTSVYETGELRAFQRSTAAHNTVEVQGENSSEVWGGFRVAKRARVKNKKFEEQVNSIAQAEHDGYCRLKTPVKHKRKFELSDNSLCVYDEIDKPLQATARFYLHPDCRVQENEGGTGFSIYFGKADQKFLSEFMNAEAELKKTYWYPEFSVQQTNFCIELRPTHTSWSAKFSW